MGTTRSMWVAGIVTAVAAGIGAFGANVPRAWADEDPLVAKVAALEATVAEHVTAKATDSLKADVVSAADLYKENDKKDPLRERILKILGGIARQRADDVVKAAILAIGDTKDPAGAKHIRGFLHAIDEKTRVPVSLDASLDAAKQIPEDSLVDPLLSIVDDSKNIAIAVKAMDALSTFGGLKRNRERIVEALAKSVARSQTGRKGPGSPGSGSSPGGDSMGPGGDTTSPGSNQAGTADRWKALSSALPTTLNSMTGQSASSAEDWFGLIKTNKASLGALFKNPPTDGK